MKPSELRALTIRELAPLLAPLGFAKWVAKVRDFRRPTPFGWQAVFMEDILHASDVHFSVGLRVRFDVYERERARVLRPGEAPHPGTFTLQTEIGSWHGELGRRYAVHAPEEAAPVAARIARDVGLEALPFFARFSHLREVYRTVSVDRDASPRERREALRLVPTDFGRGLLGATLAHLYGGDTEAEAAACRAVYTAMTTDPASNRAQGEWFLGLFDRYLGATDGGRTVAERIREAGLA